MRQSGSRYWYFMSRQTPVPMRSTIGRVAGLLAGILCLLLTVGFAKEPALNEDGSNSKASVPGAAAEGAIPACLTKLNLTQTQEAQAKEIARKFDTKLDATWNEFGKKYMETVRTDVALLAAIEDNLTDQQRTYARSQRHKLAHGEKAREGTSGKTPSSTVKVADPIEQEISGVAISLTAEQEGIADRIHQQYLGRLRGLNRDIQTLHSRLIALEADKLAELEKLLTKEQLSQLRETRQSANSSERITSSEKKATKSE